MPCFRVEVNSARNFLYRTQTIGKLRIPLYEISSKTQMEAWNLWPVLDSVKDIERAGLRKFICNVRFPQTKHVVGLKE